MKMFRNVIVASSVVFSANPLSAASYVQIYNEYSSCNIENAGCYFRTVTDHGFYPYIGGLDNLRSIKIEFRLDITGYWSWYLPNYGSGYIENRFLAETYVHQLSFIDEFDQGEVLFPDFRYFGEYDIRDQTPPSTHSFSYSAVQSYNLTDNRSRNIFSVDSWDLPFYPVYPSIRVAGQYGYYVGGEYNCIGCSGFSRTGTAQSNLSVALTYVTVPEPTTWVFFIVGFGVTGVILRRNRRITRARYANTSD